MKTCTLPLSLLAAALAGSSVALAQTPGVGIGVLVPLSRLHVANGSVLFSAAGDVSGNALPITGTGRRLLWYADKAAFRAGYVGSYASDYWDDSNIGLYSFAAGQNTLANGNSSLAIGQGTTASGESAVALGNGSQALGNYSFSVGGYATGYNGICLGSGTQATNNDALALGSNAIASGQTSVAIGPSIATGNFGVAIGLQNQANATFSTALGKNARANHQGSMTISDASATFSSEYLASTGNNQLNMRFSGGYWLYTSANANAPGQTGPISGVQLAAGAGAWTTLSDRRRKENFRPIDAEQVLRQVAALPITEWNYKSQPATQRHVGPMAQDFYQAFHLDGLGRDTTINTADIDGINMVAVQALAARTTRLQQENEQLRAQLRQQTAQLHQQETQLTAQLQRLNERLAALEQAAPAPPRPSRPGPTRAVARN